MNVIDIGIILILIMSLIIGSKRGVIKEAVSFIGLIIIFIIAFIFKEELGNTLCKYLPFFEFSGNIKGMVAINILIYQAVAFLIIFSILFGIYAIIVKISSIFQKLVNMTLVLWIPSNLAGAIFSFLKAYIILFLVLLVIMTTSINNQIFTESKLAKPIIYNTPLLSMSANRLTKSMDEVFTLVEKVQDEKISINDANLQIIDSMLEYKVVSKKTIEQLVVLDKLDKVKGLKQILNKYE